LAISAPRLRAGSVVAVTGATGLIGRVIREHLSDDYNLRLIARRQADFPTVIADLTDLEALVTAFEGVDAVVHLAAASTVEAPWEAVLDANLVGSYNVFEAARRAAVELVIFASSNHAIGMYEVENAPDLYRLDNDACWDEHADVRPDSLYGASKVFGEALGRYYVDMHGLRVICLRIGSVLADDDPRSERVADGPGWMRLDRDHALARLRATWMSQRDCAQLVRRCLEATDVRWAVAYGISDNPRKFWDLTSAREILGFTPVDQAPG
jgi:NAD+ dependent glucose-6-phosphate dehydrogenase